MGVIKEERIGNQRLILGDCLKVMPLLGRFDAVVTDPPYGIGDIMVGSGRFAVLCKRMGGDDGWDKSPPPRVGFPERLSDDCMGRKLSRLAAVAGLAGMGQDQRRSNLCNHRACVVKYGL